MTTKATPGPWNVHPGQRNLVMGNGHEIALGMYWTGIEEAAEVNANARLIAAAPDLLEACEIVVDNENSTIPVDVKIVLHAAIAKARGES